MNKEFKSVIKEIDKTLATIDENKTYPDYKSAVTGVDMLLEKLEEKNKKK